MAAVPYGFGNYAQDPPSAALVADVHAEAQRVAAVLIAHCNGKAVSVRVEVRFGDGSIAGYEGAPAARSRSAGPTAHPPGRS